MLDKLPEAGDLIKCVNNWTWFRLTIQFLDCQGTYTFIDKDYLFINESSFMREFYLRIAGTPMTNDACLLLKRDKTQLIFYYDDKLYGIKAASLLDILKDFSFVSRFNEIM